MNALLLLSATLLFITGAAHSYLGERYILIRLFRRDNLPKIFGSQDFTCRTLRFAWHITTVCFWGFAAILAFMAYDALHFKQVAAILAGTFLVCGLISLIGSKGRHLSWLVFLLVGGVCLWTVSILRD